MYMLYLEMIMVLKIINEYHSFIVRSLLFNAKVIQFQQIRIELKLQTYAVYFHLPDSELSYIFLKHGSPSPIKRIIETWNTFLLYSLNKLYEVLGTIYMRDHKFLYDMLITSSNKSIIFTLKFSIFFLYISLQNSKNEFNVEFHLNI